MDSNMKLFQS